MKPEAWKTITSRYLAQSYWVSIREDSCQLASGQVIEPYYVFEYRPWVNVIALTSDNQVVMVRQYRHGIEKTILELPGGMLDPEDSSPMAAMQRELLEETGYSATDWVETGRTNVNPSSNTNEAICFLATGAKKVAEQHLDETEELEVVLISFEQLIQMTMDSQIVQATNVSSLFYTLAYLGRISEQ